MDVSCGWDNATAILNVFSIHESDILTLLFLIVCFVVGVSGNTAVLIVYCQFYRQSNYRIYVLFIAFIDTTFCLAVLPFYWVSIAFRYQFHWDVICRGGCFLAVFLSIASLMILVIVAIDRYIVVLRPMNSQLGEVHATKCCLAVLILCGVLSWYSALIYGVKTEDLNGANLTTCDSLHSMAKANSYILVSCSVLLSSFFVVTYGGIWYKIGKHSRQLGTSARRSRTRQTVIIYIAMTAIFSTSTLLATSLNVLRETAPSLICHVGSFEKTILSFLLFLHCINHVSNPIIYLCRDQKFKNSCMKLCCINSTDSPAKSSSQSGTSLPRKCSSATIKRQDISADFSSNH